MLPANTACLRVDNKQDIDTFTAVNHKPLCDFGSISDLASTVE